MLIKMQSGVSDASLHFNRWQTAIVGKAVDDRGEVALSFASRNSNSIRTLIYDSKKLEIVFNGERFVAEDIASIIKPLLAGTILLEATTLRFPEILLFLKAMKKLGCSNVSLLYIEPEYYRSPHRNHVLRRRDFELSNDVEGFLGVPGSLIRLRDNRPTRAVFLLGYEGDRLYKALEQTGIKPSKCSVVFGVPAFRPGWEMDSFANNVNVIEEQKIVKGILFAGAQNPLSAFESIKKVYHSCGDEERLIIAPIGTKPHGIGAALFACEYNDVGVVYDYPAKRQERSKSIGDWHLFNVDFDKDS